MAKRINCRRKGAVAERHYARVFREMGFEHCQTSRYASRYYDDLGVDLVGLPVNIQIKAGKQKNLRIKECIGDIKGRLEEVGDDKPFALIRRMHIEAGKRRQDIDELVTMTFEDFCKLIIKAYGQG